MHFNRYLMFIRVFNVLMWSGFVKAFHYIFSKNIKYFLITGNWGGGRRNIMRDACDN